MQQPQQPGKILRWVRIEDDLPPVDLTVLICLSNEQITKGWINKSGRWSGMFADGIGTPKMWPVTHWMNLPLPPNSVEDLSAPASPVEETENKRKIPAEIAAFILSISKGTGGDCYIIDACEKLYHHLTESKPSPVIEIGEQKGAGVNLIAEERRRQIEVEGWGVDHDAEHDKGEMIA